MSVAKTIEQGAKSIESSVKSLEPDGFSSECIAKTIELGTKSIDSGIKSIEYQETRLTFSMCNTKNAFIDNYKIPTS